jgi:hypothetical protein
MKLLPHPIKVLLVVLAASALAGCAGSPAATAGPPSPQASTTPSPAAAPSSTDTDAATTSAPASAPPVDVARQFAAKVVDPAFEAAGPITGTVRVGNLEGTVTGTMAVQGRSSALQLAFDFPGVSSWSTYKLRVDDRSYESRNGGPWFEVAGVPASSAMASLLSQSAVTVSDQGVLTKLGEPLHHLVPATSDALTAVDVGFSDPSMVEGTATLDFYVRDDGSLAVMSMGLAWDADVGGQPVESTLDMEAAFAAGDRAVVLAPDEVWTWFTSEQHGYTIGHPTDMRLIPSTSANDPDVFGYSSTSFATAIRENQPKAAVDNLGAYVRAFRRATDWTSKTDQATEVAGRPAWRLAYVRKVNGEKLYFVFTLLIQGRDGYTIAAVGPADAQADVLRFHEWQLTTLSLPGDAG